jgi:hypothetical protein
VVGTITVGEPTPTRPVEVLVLAVVGSVVKGTPELVLTPVIVTEPCVVGRLVKTTPVPPTWTEGLFTKVEPGVVGMLVKTIPLPVVKVDDVLLVARGLLPDAVRPALSTAARFELSLGRVPVGPTRARLDTVPNVTGPAARLPGARCGIEIPAKLVVTVMFVEVGNVEPVAVVEVGVVAPVLELEDALGVPCMMRLWAPEFACGASTIRGPCRFCRGPGRCTRSKWRCS